jgi:hypothetical protein
LKGVVGEEHGQQHQGEHHKGQQQGAVAGGLNRHQKQ